jgi:hypothetical protein
MTLLLISYVCDRCEGAPRGSYYRGYIVWDPRRHLPRKEYVFRDRDVAEYWRSIRQLEDSQIREVLCEHEIRWHVGRGTIKNLELADHLYEIYADHRFPPGPYRAFLAPEGYEEDSEIRILTQPGYPNAISIGNP